jgi:hypothetical protein
MDLQQLRRAMIYCGLAVLLASCNGVKEQGTRPALTGVYKAARSIEGALAVGVTYPEYGTLIRNFSTELLMARDHTRFDMASRDLTAVLDKYTDLLIMYKDSSTVWGLQIEKKTNVDLSSIAAKYGMSSAIREVPMAVGSYKYKETVADYETIRQTIWERAGKLHEQQLAIVYGYPLERATTK